MVEIVTPCQFYVFLHACFFFGGKVLAKIFPAYFHRKRFYFYFCIRDFHLLSIFLSFFLSFFLSIMHSLVVLENVVVVVVKLYFNTVNLFRRKNDTNNIKKR